MTSDQERDSFYLPPENAVCTKTFWQFLSAYRETIDFFFTVQLAHRADYVSLTAAQALIGGEKDDEEKARLQERIENSGRVAKRLANFSEIISRNILTNFADSFLWYISNIIQQSIKKRPELIKSGESVRVDEIFNYSSRRDLINYLIDRKINSLSYGGLKQIEKYLAESLNIELFNAERDRNLLRIFIEVRNIHAHNRGVVNKIFLDRVGNIIGDFDFKFEEGRKAHLDFDALVDFSKVCVATAYLLDANTSKKFSIERKKISTWLRNSQGPHSKDS